MAVTTLQYERARTLGTHRALVEKQIKEEPTDEVFEGFEDRQDLIFNVTGEKVSPDSEDGWVLLDAYENAYYDEWEE